MFGLMFLLYTISSFIFMYFYWRKSMSWRHRAHSHDTRFYEHDISLHTIMVRNLPEIHSTQEMSEILKEVFSSLFGARKVIMARAQPF